jgi:hypothetical protein
MERRRKDYPTTKVRVQVRLTKQEILAIFSAINTAGLHTQGSYAPGADPLESHLVAAIERLESASGLHCAEADEWQTFF